MTSEVFFKALKNLGKFHWRDVPFSSWLYRIAAHEIANHFRKNKQEQFCLKEVYNSISISNPSAETELLEAEAEIKRHEEFLTLHQSIFKLSIKYQEVIMLRFFENKQIRETGEILGKREGTVKSLLHRGLKKLRELMEWNATFWQKPGYSKWRVAMKEEELIKKLENVELPTIELQSHRRRLRMALLDAGYLKRQRGVTIWFCLFKATYLRPGGNAFFQS